MKLAMMQPYFFPYLGQFDLLHRVDIWIAHDQLQYIRRGWVNRNRILSLDTGWQYITVPVNKHHRSTPINQMEASEEVDWRNKIIKNLSRYKRQAPYYSQVLDLVNDCFSLPEKNLAKLNIALFRKTAQRLGIITPVHVFSEMNVDGAESTSAEEMVVRLCAAVGATEYNNPPGGVDLYHAEFFARHGIKLAFQDFTAMTYRCGTFDFVPNLSILDVMMWNSPSQIMNHLNLMRMQNE
jgi:hypothetical protein